MTHLKNYLSISFLLSFIVSCHQQKEQYYTEQVPHVKSGNITETPGSVVHADVASLNNSYISSITQTFIAKAATTTLLTGRHGLKITVTPADLETIDGEAVTGDITVKMVELTNTDELFKSNAATMSNGSLLVSGGSYYIGMQSNGRELKVKYKHAVKMEFPKLQNSDMELFYGERDANNNMNWVRAGEPLMIQTMNYTPFNPPFPPGTKMSRFKSRYRMFNSLSAKIFFMDKYITIKQMVDQLQQKGIDKNIDSIEIPWEDFYGRAYTVNERLPYTPTIKRYRILSCSQIQAEHDSIADLSRQRQYEETANKKYYEEWQKTREENSVENQIQKYYAPAGITSLGWINCDRFYDQPQNTDIPFEMPYTFNAPAVQYFLIYKSINGLMSGQVMKDAGNRYTLSHLPRGQSVTLVAFVKDNNGKLYHCKEDFVIEPGKKLKPEFTIISHEEMTRMFGGNVKI